LRTTGSAVAGAGLFTTTAAASERRKKDSTDSTDVETLAKSGNQQIIKVDRDEDTHTFQVDTEKGSATKIEVDTGKDNTKQAEMNESVASSILDNEGEVQVQNHDDVIERSSYDFDETGDCPGKIYNGHASLVFAFETGESLDEYPTGVLSAALCAVIGALGGSLTGNPYAAAAIAVLGAIVCYSFSFFFLDHLDLSKQTGAIGGWDCHKGWLNEEGICYGASPSYTTDLDDLSYIDKISGPHLTVGDSVTDYL